MRRPLALLLLAALPAQADPHYARCHGKYENAAAMLDATYGTYGTLYSGDFRAGIGADLGPTLDLYRLWHGLPDANFRAGADLVKPTWTETQPSGHPWQGQITLEWADFALTLALPYALAPNPTQPTPGPREWVAHTLDVLTVPGPMPDWWFNPEAEDYLTNTEALIAYDGRKSDVIDWLLGATVQSAYPIFAWPQPDQSGPLTHQTKLAPYAIPRFDTLATRYWRKYDRTLGLEWAALAMLFPTPADHTETAERLTKLWLTRVQDCSATPAQYAAFAVTYYDQSGRNFWRNPVPEPTAPLVLLPGQMQRELIRREARSLLARRTVSGGIWARNGLDETTELTRLAALIAQQTPTDYQTDLRQIQSFFADTIEAFTATLQTDDLYWAAPQINLLSTANLRHLARDSTLPAELRINVARIAFLRLLALGHYDLAASALTDYLTLFPDDRPAAASAAAATSDQKVRLALTALAIPELTTRIERVCCHDPKRPRNFRGYIGPQSNVYSADLPDWLRMGGGLQRGVDRSLAVGSFWFSQKGYATFAFNRLYDRGQTPAPPEPRFVAFPPQGPNTPGVPFARLVALDETARLGPDTGLTQRLSEIVIHWAQDGAKTLPDLIRNQSGPMPQALAQIVQLNRYRTTGEVDGTFAGQAAFHLLQTRFPLSAAARSTHYWFRCQGWKCDR